MKIAIYGKGGIGKSTISANISSALAMNNKKILQIGCDPKQDSTRLLLNGKRIPSVLEYIKNTSVEKQKLEDVIYKGIYGIHCIEAGGPEPGVGCAGRGILSTFELLEKLNLDYSSYDSVIYDVLGDVVCGGFAVPMREEYAEKIYIVSSGEFMSIYAANNILKGVNNYKTGENRLGGIIYNARGLEDEDERMKRFSEAVKLPIIARIPRSELFATSEKESMCLMEKYPNSDIAGIFTKLADDLLNQDKFYKARPLDNDLLEEKVLLTKRKDSKTLEKAYDKKEEIREEKVSSLIYSKNVKHKEPLHGCAYSGAASVSTQVKESATISHGPDSCSHITYQNISSLARRTLLERGISLPIQTAPPFYSSEMDENVMIFGGLDNLFEKVKEIKKNKPKAIFILTTCPSGIIGDDISQVVSLEDKDTKIIPIETDGNIKGDYLQGILMAYKLIGENIIDRSVRPKKSVVNLIGEKAVSKETDYNYRFIKDILEKIGVKINTRFIYNTDYKSIENFLEGELNLLAYDDFMGRQIKKFLLDEYGVKFFERPFPIGFDESKEWFKDLCIYFNKEDKYEEILSAYEKEYEEKIKIYRKNLKGKKLMLVNYNQDIDWVLKTAIDLGLSIEFVGILDFSQEDTFKTNYMDYIKEFHMNYDPKKREEDIKRVGPDILLTNYSFPELSREIFSDTIPLSPTVGFFSGLYFAKRWSEFVEKSITEGWKEDEYLFKKYFS